MLYIRTKLPLTELFITVAVMRGLTTFSAENIQAATTLIVGIKIRIYKFIFARNENSRLSNFRVQ